MNLFKKFCSVTEKLLSVFVGYMLIVMTILAFTGVLTRYVFVISLPWVDEVTRYLMIWMTFLVSAIAVGDGSHTNVEIIPSLLNKKLKKFDYGIVIDLLILLGMCIYTYYNIKMVQSSIKIGNTSPVLRIPMWFMYCSTLVSAFFSILYSFRNIAVRIGRLKEKKEEDK